MVPSITGRRSRTPRITSGRAAQVATQASRPDDRNRGNVKSDLGRKIAVDFQADADLDQGRGRPSHGCCSSCKSYDVRTEQQPSPASHRRQSSSNEFSRARLHVVTGVVAWARPNEPGWDRALPDSRGADNGFAGRGSQAWTSGWGLERMIVCDSWPWHGTIAVDFRGSAPRRPGRVSPLERAHPHHTCES